MEINFTVLLSNGIIYIKFLVQPVHVMPSQYLLYCIIFLPRDRCKINVVRLCFFSKYYWQKQHASSYFAHCKHSLKALSANQHF